VDPQGVPTERAEGAQAARQNDDLLMFAGAADGVEHPLDAVIIAIHKRVIEDDDGTAVRSCRGHRPAGVIDRAIGSPARR